jgi:hypothetical protein
MKRSFLMGLVSLLACGLPLGALAQAEPSARLQALAEQVLVASGNDPRASAMNRGFPKENLVTALRTALPDATADWQTVMDAAVQDEMALESDEYFRESVNLYASRFTEAELEDMLAFYQSPGGKALVAQLPAITAAKLKFRRELGPAIERMVKAVCEKKACAGRAP